MFISTKKRILLALFTLFCLSESFKLSAKPKDSEESEYNGIYKKYVHPREYIFDLADAKNKVSLKIDDSNGKGYCNVDFTDLVKEQMPRKGDKITFTYEGTSSKDVQSITASVYDLTKGQNIGNKIPEIFTTAVGKKQTFKKTFSLILNEDAEKSFTLRLVANLPEKAKKTDKIDLSFKRVTQSTNTKKEAEEEKDAIKKGLKIVRIKSNYVVVEKKEKDLPEEPAPVAQTENVQESLEEAVPEEQIEEVAVEEEIIEESIVEEIETEEIIVEEPEVLEETVENEETEETEETPEVEEIPEKVVIVIEPEVPVAVVETVEPVVEEPKKEESTYEPIIVINKVSRYEKEYLQDFAVMDELELYETEKVEVKKIEEPDKRDGNGRTLLMLAVKNGDKNQIKELILSGADVNLKDKEGWTALMYAARYQKDLSILDLLIDSEAQIKTKNKYGLSALMFAASYNSNPQVLNRLIQFYSPSDKEVLKSFVIMLSESSNEETVQLAKTKVFMDYSIPINAYYSGKTPLMYACQYSCYTKVIRVLLENNASTKLRSTEGKTAFDYAVNNINLEHDAVYWTLNKK